MKYRQKVGFTLVELLVVTGIISLITVVIVQVFFTTMRTNAKTEIIREVKQTGDRSLDTISRMVQNASSILIDAASCPESGQSSVVVNDLTLINADGGRTTIRCENPSIDIARIASVSGSVSTYVTGSTITLVDTSNTVSCGSGATGALQFTCTSLGSVPSLIKINYTIRQKSVSASTFESSTIPFQATVTIRNR